LLLAAVAIVLVLSVFVWWLLRDDVRQPTVAVLPFQNFTGDPSLEYLGDGVAEEIINALAKVPQLKVTGRSWSFQFRGSGSDPAEIARQLGVAYLVEGSVRRNGQKLRFTAQLIEADSGYHVWSDTSELGLLEIFDGQDRISTDLASALTADLNIEYVRADSKGQAAPHPEAYDLYLRGRQIWHRRGSMPMRQAIDNFAEAVKIDPSFARGWAALASAYVSYPSYSAEGISTYRLAEDVAAKAIELDPGLSEPYGVLGTFAMRRREWAEAGRLFAEGVRLNEQSVTAHHWYSEYLLQVGHITQSLHHVRRAMELDPTYLQPQADVAWAHLLFGNPATGAKLFRDLWQQGYQGIESWVGNLLSSLLVGDTEAALEWVEISPGAENANDFLRRFVALRQGSADDAELFNEILALSEPGPDHRTIIWTAALVRDYDTIFRFLHDRIAQGREVDTMMLWGPDAGLRDQPEFVELLEELGLIDYWNATGWGDVCRLLDTVVVCDVRDVALDVLAPILRANR
jgi:TolB-like protein